MGKLYAIGDIHLGHPFNTEAWKALEEHPGDGLILCGDVGETAAHLELAFGAAARKFRTVWWCPGNHELYTMALKTTLRGEDKYAECVDIARRHGVHTPEDDFVEWRGEGGDGQAGVIVAPIFTLYDYTFRPDGMDKKAALEWASAADTVATDEFLLHPDPFPTREDWCDALVAKAERKLTEANERGLPLIIVSFAVHLLPYISAARKSSLPEHVLTRQIGKSLAITGGPGAHPAGAALQAVVRDQEDGGLAQAVQQHQSRHKRAPPRP